MKKIIKTGIGCLMTLIMIIIPLCYLSKITERKASAIKYEEFFEDKMDYDVLFLGSSHMIDGISPMDMWHDYGITSYNLGGHSNTVPTSYWVLMNALDYTTPKLVVMDGYLITSQYKISNDNYSSVHNSLDAFPLTFTKIKGVLDLLNDSNIEAGIENGEVKIDEDRIPLGLLWDFSVYHSRWNEISENDFNPPKTYNKGAEDRISLVPMELHENNNIDNLNSVGVEYLDKIVDECEKRGIEILLVYLPAKDGYQSQANWMEKYAYEKGLDFINFTDGSCINPAIDFSDAAGHMNPSGAKKITAFIGDYIKKRYSIEGDYNIWESDYEEYVSYKTNLIKQQKDIKNYLMLLNDSSYETKIICDEKFMLEYRELIDNISILGACDITIIDDNTYDDGATIDVYYNNQIVDSVILDVEGIIRN
jgi:hypothetical protein